MRRGVRGVRVRPTRSTSSGSAQRESRLLEVRRGEGPNARSDGRGVRRFSRSGLRHVELPEGAILVEQNPKKSSEWAELARRGHRVAWVMRDGAYLARVVDGEVTFLD